jgi:ankyrin repeat protein
MISENTRLQCCHIRRAGIIDKTEGISMAHRVLGAFAAVVCLLAPAYGEGRGDNLLQAIERGDVDGVRKLLKQGADINAKDPSGATALMYASVYSTAECMRLLLDKGADPNGQSDTGATALMWGIADARKANLLIEKGANVNARSKAGMTPLLLAAQKYGAVETVKLLLSKGADAKAVDGAGASAVVHAAAGGDIDVVKALLAGGADSQSRRKVPDMALLDRGNAAVLKEVMEIAARRVSGTTALMSAVGGNHIEIVKLLLSSGADVNASTPSGTTALLLAAPKGNAALVKLLLDHGAQVNARNERGFTPLMQAGASDSKNVEVVRLLIAARADVKAKTTDGETVLAWASKLGQTAIVKALKEAGASE